MSEQQNPVDQHPTPDFPSQDQPHPGWTGPMDPPRTTVRTPTGAAAAWRTVRP